MGKYQLLSEFLRRQTDAEIPMTFDQIERVIGERLPRGATRHRSWWSNNPSNSVITAAWLEAGFHSKKVDIEGRRLVFRRIEREQTLTKSGDEPTAEIHPLIGWMKDTV